MAGNEHVALLRGRGFNTLAQTGTEGNAKNAIRVQGEGTDLTKREALKGRAKRKMITQTVTLSLIEVARNKGADEREKGYWNTWHCQNTVVTADGRMYGPYCKNRFCALCCSIRKADIINRYLPEMQKWKEPYFVTLTVKAIPAWRLPAVLRKMIECFDRIKEKHKKRFQRGAGIKLVGVRSLECNFNEDENTYNPHCHVIVENKEMADILVNEWLKRWGDVWTKPWAQFSVKINHTQKCLLEVVKYGAKTISEPGRKRKKKAKAEPRIYASALDNIFHAMKGLRIFERFGFNLPKPSQPKTPKSRVVREYCEWVFHPSWYDWLLVDDGQKLSDYRPPAELIDLLSNKIDILRE